MGQDTNKPVLVWWQGCRRWLGSIWLGCVPVSQDSSGSNPISDSWQLLTMFHCTIIVYLDLYLGLKPQCLWWVFFLPARVGTAVVVPPVRCLRTPWREGSVQRERSALEEVMPRRTALEDGTAPLRACPRQQHSAVRVRTPNPFKNTLQKHPF